MGLYSVRGKEIPQYAEYCDECAEKRMSRIGGWLWLPLITLFCHWVPVVTH